MKYLAWLLLTGLAFSQGAPFNDVALTGGVGIAGATVQVCVHTASQSCTSPASIFQDSFLSNPQANPMTADAAGFYHFYAAPGLYDIAVSGTGFLSKTYTVAVSPPVSTASPSNNQVLAYNSSTGLYTPTSIAGIGGTNANQLQGFSVSGNTPTDQQVLQFVGANNDWEPKTLSGLNGNATSVQGIAVSSTTPTNGQVYAFNSTNNDLEPTTVSGNATSLQGKAISSTSPSASQVLQWSGTAWTPVTLVNTTLNPVFQGTLTLDQTSGQSADSIAVFQNDGTTNVFNVDKDGNIKSAGNIQVGNAAPAVSFAAGTGDPASCTATGTGAAAGVYWKQTAADTVVKYSCKSGTPTADPTGTVAEMSWTSVMAAFGGSVNHTVSGFSFLRTASAITVTRIMVKATGTAGTCSVPPVIRITDGSTPIDTNVAAASALADSGVISQNYAANTLLQMNAIAGTCTTDPTWVEVQVQYKMQ